jgi:microcin-processing metallopeptidase PmbA/TldD-like protein
MKFACIAVALSAVFLFAATDAPSDVVLQAMRDELERSKSLRIASLDAPYYIEYRVEDADVLAISATLGGLVSSTHSPLRIPSVKLRVGSYTFDNTNHVYSDYYSGSRYDPERLPLENNYSVMRQDFWLATDRAFKAGEEAIARKRSALKNLNLPEQLPDYSPAPAAQSLLPIKRARLDEEAWKARAVKLSAVFATYPRVLASSLEFQASQSTDYLVNSEGSAIRIPENLAFVRVRALAQAPDGMSVRDAEVFQAFEPGELPSETQMRTAITKLASDVDAMSQAPFGDAYTGPVLFEARASAQLFGQLLGDNLKITRKPAAEPGRTVPWAQSELQNRVGSKVLPEWMDVVDDPTQTEWRGETLFGHYLFDMEGVAPKPLTLIEKGALKNFLLTRTPVMKGFEASNGRGRMPGSYGASSPGFGNLFVRASQTVSPVELKKKLIELCKQRNKPYGMLVRKIDFPSSGTLDELRRAAAAVSQSGGGARPVSLPLLVYRVYPDGREELVRGLRFRGLSTRSLRDILAASNESYVFNFMDAPVPFALMGAGGFVTNASVIAPAVLFDEVEFERVQDDLPKPPLVPPPPL